MINRKMLVMVAILFAAISFTGCKKKDEKIIGPEITFANDITETTASSYRVSVTIASSDGLQEVIIEKIVLLRGETELIEKITDFSDPKKFTYEEMFVTNEYCIIKFTATDKKGRTNIKSFEFKFTK